MRRLRNGQTHNSGQIYNFFEYKNTKPYFKYPIKITVCSNPINDTYYMLKNIVYKGRQILALSKEQEPSTIILAEGEIMDGQLQYLLRLPDESISEIKMLFEGTL
ncbi:hypothetical protein [Bacillus sp. T3]|uniref:hypothetical protein n=1 Tax=Bacillus sp. T3 TaxID=467262 RepID=UPI002981A99F|nr:hypothetical protein [Bacillus sp. T3]